MTVYLWAVLAGYAAGCSNLAYFVARAKGFDIRTRGVNSAGASNAAITMGRRFGVLVAVHDIGKAFLAAFLAARLWPEAPLIGLAAGAAAVLGHIFPFYLRFRGGKGFASFLGLILAVDWRFFLAILAVIVLLVLATDYIVVGTLTAVTAFPLYLAWQTRSLLAAAIAGGVSAVIWLKHGVNVRRICSGQEVGVRQTMLRRRELPEERRAKK